MLLKNGDGGFGVSEVEDSNYRFSRKLVDVDNDGDLDVLSWSPTSLWWTENVDAFVVLNTDDGLMSSMLAFVPST